MFNSTSRKFNFSRQGFHLLKFTNWFIICGCYVLFPLLWNVRREFSFQCNMIAYDHLSSKENHRTLCLWKGKEYNYGRSLHDVPTSLGLSLLRWTSYANYFHCFCGCYITYSQHGESRFDHTYSFFLHWILI